MSIKLTIDNSTCKLEGLDKTQFNALRELMSYKVDPQASYFAGKYGLKRYLLDKRGFFPTGLLYMVEKYLQNTDYTVNDIRKRPGPILGRFNALYGVTPYPEQKEAAEACLKANRGIVVAPTGVGKSLIVALVIEKLQVNTLVVVPTLELKRQLQESLKSIFGSLKGVTVQNIDALNPNIEAKGIDCVIIDEFHHSGAKSYRKLNKKAWKNVYYKFGMTATPFRSKDTERLLLESVLSKVIYQISYKEAVDNSYIVPLEAYYYELPKQRPKCDTTSWQSVYYELVVGNKNRNKLIQDVLENLKSSGKKSICLVKEIDHGLRLSSIDKFFPFVNGSDIGSRAWLNYFCEGKCSVLIGTNGVLGEGVDTKPAEYIIIAGLGKSKNAFMQQCGRGFRKYPGKESCKVILFKDPSHKWTLTHFNSQVKYLKEEYGVKPVKLEL